MKIKDYFKAGFGMVLGMWAAKLVVDVANELAKKHNDTKTDKTETN